jgi:hypothetical protein
MAANLRDDNQHDSLVYMQHIAHRLEH